MISVVIVGLGSMGKRRIRNLQFLKAKEIVGFDLREDRRKEAEEKYGIKTVSDLKKVNLSNFDGLVVSTPPHLHNQYIRLAIDYKKPAFIEASVILEGLAELNKLAKKGKVLIAPSCTLRFHSAIKKIKEIVESDKYGKVANFSYHCGQYLPDWHPWEKVTSFYAGQRETGGAREIVPFELTWIVDIVGFPKNIKGFYGKTMNVGADIDDTYAISMDFGGVLGNMIIDVVARYATRNLILNMEKGQILWRWDEDKIRLFDAAKRKWAELIYQIGKAEMGYNSNIAEKMYIDEMRAFIDAVLGKGEFPNSLDDDIGVLKLLNEIESKI